MQLCGVPRFVLLVVAAASGPALAENYEIDGKAMGPVLDSIGAQSTAGTARFLLDYPPAQRALILDYLFKPSYGASLQHLKVEIGGDAQISCGAEPSPMRSPNPEDADFNRGCEFELEPHCCIV